jgi:hypothetical protein
MGKGGTTRNKTIKEQIIKCYVGINICKQIELEGEILYVKGEKEGKMLHARNQ